MNVAASQRDCEARYQQPARLPVRNEFRSRRHTETSRGEHSIEQNACMIETGIRATRMLIGPSLEVPSVLGANRLPSR